MSITYKNGEIPQIGDIVYVVDASDDYFKNYDIRENVGYAVC